MFEFLNTVCDWVRAYFLQKFRLAVPEGPKLEFSSLYDTFYYSSDDD